MPKRRYTLLLAALFGAGVCLVSAFAGDDLAIARKQMHLDVIGSQLAGLKELLRDFRKAHGRYPTNDEGLAALDNFESRWAVPGEGVMRSRNTDTPGEEYFAREKQWWMQFGLPARHVSGSEGLRRWARELNGMGSPFACGTPDPGEPKVVVEMAAGTSGDPYILSPAGILSPWLIPYVYENRAHLPAAAFAGSPADADPLRRYSVRVDEGVFVSCAGGERYAAAIDARRNGRIAMRLLGALLVLAALTGMAVLARSAARRYASALRGVILLAVSAGVGVFLPQALGVTCYAMVPLFSHRSADMVSRRLELLEKHRAAGVITRATYDKTLAVLQNGPATSRPASRPGE